MAPPPKRPFLQLAMVAALAAVLVLLAVLQYRWSLEISRAERARIEASLNTSVRQFRQEFYRELVQVSTAFHSEPGAEPDSFWSTYAERYQAWARTASRPDLIANVYVWQGGAKAHSQLLLLRPATNQFEPVDWPASLAGLRARLEEEGRQPPGPPGPEMRLFAWTMEEQIPALVHAVSDISGPRRRRDREPAAPPPRVLGFVIVELSRAALDQHFAESAQRYFAGPEGFIYNVAVLSGEPAGTIVYRSDPQLDAASLVPPDARSPLLAATPEEYRTLGDAPPRQRPGRPPNGRGGAARAAGFLPRARGAVILLPAAAEPWQLLVRHRGGSLESVVAADRRRNLLFSFGVLLLLAAGMALIVISAQRARRLARLQMEFVAGVSHELRTPVAVICSAADNLAEGFVGAKEQVREYGAVIRDEGRRLAGMVEQILHFAAGQSGRATYDLKPLPVSEAIAAAVSNLSGLPEAEGFTPELEIDPHLPLVAADAVALTRCLQNLIFNALKYGGESRWVRVRAEKVGSGDAPRVRISVEDRGMGIDAADLPHIFEPFYRGKAAQAAQIHGAGLGLSLVRDIAEALNGRLTVASAPGRGSTFTLDLPAAAPAAEPVPHPA